MAKLKRPLLGEIWITQTYHTASNNTAVDFSAVAETPVYAVADGVVTYRSSGAGSYCIQTLDNSDLKVYYVHTYKWVAANTRVMAGQIICYVAPTSLNGGYPTHLHLGLQTGKYLMDYMDRGIAFRTKYADIKAIWFIGENLDWSKFKDLNYDNTAMFKIGDKIEFTGIQNIRKGSGTSFPVTGSTAIGMLSIIEDGPRVADGHTWWDLNNGDWVADVGKFKLYVKPPEPPAPPEPTECEKQVTRLEGELEVLESTTEAQGVQITTLRAEVDEKKGDLEKLQIMFDGLQGSYNILEQEKLDLQEELSRCKLELQESKQNFIKKILDAIREWLSKTVG